MNGGQLWINDAEIVNLPPSSRRGVKAIQDQTHLKAGFNIRGESWDGAIKPGKRKVVKHQLFRGNEYWFWLGKVGQWCTLSLVYRAGSNQLMPSFRKRY